MIRLIVIILLTFPTACLSADITGSFFLSAPSGSAPIFTYSHNCDALGDAQIATLGSAVVTYDPAITITSGAWDIDGAYNGVEIPGAGNINWVEGRYSFEFTPQELAAGYIVQASDGASSFSISQFSSTEITVNWRGSSSTFIHGMSIGSSTCIEFFFRPSADPDKIYVLLDGLYMGSIAGTGTTPSGNMIFGSTDANSWGGLIDDVNFIAGDSTIDICEVL